MIDESTEFGARVARHLREDRVVWLTTVTPSGAPLPSPVWFWWDGEETVRVFSLPDTGRVRAVQNNPKVSLNFAGNGQGGDIVVLSGEAPRRRGQRRLPSGLRREVRVRVRAPRPDRRAVRAEVQRAAGHPPHEGPRPLIRLATPEDADTVAGLLIAFRNWWGSSTPSDETFKTTVAKLIHDPNTEYLLAGDQGVAQLRYRLSAWTGVEDCWLEDLYVTDDARGTGLGKALLEACFERARARGCRRIELDVNEQNTTAIAVYERSGFLVEPKPPGRTLFLGKKL